MAANPPIVVFRTGHLGDTVCAIPAFRMIREAYPDAHLTLLCDSPILHRVPATEVIRHLQIFDSIVSYKSRRGARSMLELALKIWQLRPRLLIILPHDREPMSSLRAKSFFLKTVGAHEVRFAESRRGSHEWRVTEAQRLCEILQHLGIWAPKPDYRIPLTNDLIASVKQKISNCGIDPESPFISFCSGGKTAVQRWPVDRYATVLKAIAAEVTSSILVIGSAEEKETCRRELLPLVPGLRILSEPTSILELFAIFSLARAYIGNDTGPMHVAAAMSCPVVAIISARNAPGAWDPDVQPRLVIRHRTECENCFLDQCTTNRHRCMLEISEARVISEAIPFLKGLPGRSIPQQH